MKFWQVLMFVLVQMVLCSACSNDLVGADPWELEENDEFSFAVPDAGEEDAGPPDPVDADNYPIPDVEEIDVNPDVDASMEGPAVAQVTVDYDSRILMGQESLNIKLNINGGEPGCVLKGFRIVYEGTIANIPYMTLDRYDYYPDWDGNILNLELTEHQPLDGFEVVFRYRTSEYGPETPAIESNGESIKLIPVLDREDCLVDQEPTVVAEFAAVDIDKGLEALDQFEGYVVNSSQLQNGRQILGIVKVEADYWENRSKIGAPLDLVIHEFNFRVEPGQGVDVYDMWINRLDEGDGQDFIFTPSFNDDGYKVFGLDTFGDRNFEISSQDVAYFLIQVGVTLSADADRELKVYYEGGMFTSDEENTPYFSLEGEVLVSEFR